MSGPSPELRTSLMGYSCFTAPPTLEISRDPMATALSQLLPLSPQALILRVLPSQSPTAKFPSQSFLPGKPVCKELSQLQNVRKGNLSLYLRQSKVLKVLTLRHFVQENNFFFLLNNQDIKQFCKNSINTGSGLMQHLILALQELEMTSQATMDSLNFLPLGLNVNNLLSDFYGL